ncbi:MAG TPA: hypothetical protein PLO53_03095 [Candidatus Hydrogenedentes bacterium]|nr:hypothetical protein [Candidatus Hydrogenedentota bacterium]HPU96922.1 hypothetical protein [Candidatus Hydrogenedentota bacterium]
MGLSSEQAQAIDAYLNDVNRVLLALTAPENAALTIEKLRQRIYTALDNGHSDRDEAVRMILQRLGDPIQLGVRLARTWGTNEKEVTPPEFPAEKDRNADTEAGPQAGPVISDRDGANARSGSAGRISRSAPSADAVSAAKEEKKGDAPASAQDSQRSEGSRQKPKAPIWLGVCLALWTVWGVPTWVSRPLLTVIGLFLWPAALPAYMALYWWLRWTGKLAGSGKVRWFHLVLDPVAVIFLVCVLYGISRAAGEGLDWLALRYLDHTLMDRMGPWNWLEPWRDTLFTVALLYAIPPAVLGAMPVSPGWSVSLRRFAFALVALYGLVVFAWIASIIAGSAIQVAHLLTGR